ncbi:hypothetical protein HanXRQr2_Chr03g0097921 [Helianthus annuus]|uniref:Uncharacterized protein n=1 Tax=Helianthus annuus TaxID=4232 RepID=A0A9K3JED4_HELAN|nr:hypothetical protein HanXRQr2_Chr03g0097921 [Helianthus annuus]
MTIPTKDAIEFVGVIGATSSFASCLQYKKTSDKSAFLFLTVGDMKLYRYEIFMESYGYAACPFQHESSNVTVSKEDDEEPKKGFTSAVMLPSGQGLLCATTDEEFLFYAAI